MHRLHLVVTILADCLQDIQAIGDILNLTNAVDQWRLLLSWVQVYRLLKVMADKVVPLQSRLTLYQELDRGEGRHAPLHTLNMLVCASMLTIVRCVRIMHDSMPKFWQSLRLLLPALCCMCCLLTDGLVPAPTHKDNASACQYV